MVFYVSKKVDTEKGEGNGFFDAENMGYPSHELLPF